MKLNAAVPIMENSMEKLKKKKKGTSNAVVEAGNIISGFPLRPLTGLNQRTIQLQ